jgi:hypothetical protein
MYTDELMAVLAPIVLCLSILAISDNLKEGEGGSHVANTVEEQRENNVGGVTWKGFLPGQSGNPGGRPAGRSVSARGNGAAV